MVFGFKIIFSAKILYSPLFFHIGDYLYEFCVFLLQYLVKRFLSLFYNFLAKDLGVKSTQE